MLRDDERRALAEMAVEDDGPEQVDPDLLAAIKELTAAVKAIKAPKMPELDVKPVAAALANLPTMDGLRGDIRALTDAVARMQPANLSRIEKTLIALQASQLALVDALSRPKEVVYDKSGNPTGVRIARMN